MTTAPNAQEVPTDDIGRAVHFRGRHDVWGRLTELLKNARVKKGGNIFLVQGPPGAGKSAILLEFGARVDRDPFWTHRDISISDLYDPSCMADALGDGSYADRIVSSKGKSLTGGTSSVIKAEYETRSEDVAARPGPSVKHLLAKHASGKGLLLTLDEVQGMRSHLALAERQTALEEILVAIRNGRIGGTVVLLAGGLGDSSTVLGQFGISRFGRGCLHNISRLKPPEERAIIRAWIVKSGRAHNVQPDVLKRWVDTIAAKTDGWPQHILNFAPQAAQWLLNNGGIMPVDVPEEVMAAGRDGKRAYYAQRVDQMEAHHIHALAALIATLPAGAPGFTKANLMAAFRSATQEHDPESEMMSPAAAADLALAKGIVAKSSPTMLHVPIPSMRRWLAEICNID